MIDDRRYIQFISALASIFTAFYIVIKSKRAGDFRAVLIVPLVLFIHEVIFYTCVFFFVVLDFDVKLGFNFPATAWSAGKSFHEIFTAIFLTYAFIKCNLPANNEK